MREKILVVEPDSEFQNQVADMLREAGYRVFGAGTYEEAAQYVNFFKPDVIIMELLLPDRNGVDLLVYAKEMLPGSKVIVYTSMKGSTIEKAVKKKGADGFIRKSGDIKKDLMTIFAKEEKKEAQGFKGSLEGVDIIDLIQAFSLMRRDLILHVRDVKTFKEGEIVFKNGEVVDAKTGVKRGEDAFLEIVGWEHGIFEVAPLKEEPEKTIDAPVDLLLLNVAKVQDEMKAVGTKIPKFTLKQILKNLKEEIPGFIGAMIFDYEEGAPIETETILEGKTFHASATLYGAILKSVGEAMEIVTEGKEKRDELLEVTITDQNDHILMIPLPFMSYAIFILITYEGKLSEARGAVKKYLPNILQILKEREAKSA
ncbi:MAG: response regulator [Candidatus Hydrothermae bacterium]|nr:response regulator [Candidatus Hydrothermae bacterium]